MATVALIRFAEKGDDIQAVDASGHLKDLGPDPTSTPALVAPDVVNSMTGRGREFGDDVGLQGVEQVADSLRLLRDVTVRAFVKYPIGAALDGDIGTIVARGVQGSAAERILFAVELERIDASTARLRARWQEADGTNAVLAGADFVPDPSGFHQVAVVRTWIDSTSVEVTYVVDDVLIGAETVAYGDIGNGSGGTLTIGCAGDGTGDYERFLPAGTIIDQVAIESDAMTYEEIRQEFLRITKHQPDGYRILRSYIPPGDTWPRDPSSRIQRWIAAEGDALGYALSLAHKLRDDFLPDRAYGAALEFWERITKLSPGPAATVATRRQNVIAALRNVLGFDIDSIQQGLSDILGLAASSIVITEYGATRRDDFDEDTYREDATEMLVTHAPTSTSWLEGVVGFDGTAGECTVFTSGAGHHWTRQGGSPYLREASICGSDIDSACIGAAVRASVDDAIVNYTCGVFFRDTSWDCVFFGLREIVDGVSYALEYWTVVDGVRTATVSIGTSADSTRDLLLRITAEGVYEAAEVIAGVVTVHASGIAGPTRPRFAGIGAVAWNAGESTAGNFSFGFVEVFEPESPRGYGFRVYRDPLLPGSYNLRTANAKLRKQQGAHTHGVVSDQAQGFVLGAEGMLGHEMLWPHPT